MRLRRTNSSLLLLLALTITTARAQQPAARPFEPGEELTYKAEVSRSLLKKIDVATFKFHVEANQTNHHGRDVRGAIEAVPSLRFVGDVASEGFFTKLFNLKFHQHV